VIADADWVVDVGGVYDPDNNRYDHHQNDAPVRDSGIPYSALGLVWLELGETIAGSKEVATQIDQRLVVPIDAGDNAVKVCDLTEVRVAPFEFFDVINAFKPVWGTDEDYDSSFREAVNFAKFMIVRLVEQTKADIDKRKFIDSIYQSANDKRLLVFDESVERDVLMDYEDVLVGVSPSSSKEAERWIAAPVPEESRDYSHRTLFPEAWAGLSDDDLETVSGIKGAVFCHKNRYMFVAKNKEAAIEAAKQAIN
jgi:uncharacterized UPF0160 family protein